jgi:hypothetical protein
LDNSVTTAPFFTGDVKHPDCVNSGCYDSHTTQGCLDSFAAAEVLDKAMPLLDRKEWASLAKLLAESEVARFNVERGALQFTGCNRMIAAHIPIADDDASQLAQAFETLNAIDD